MTICAISTPPGRGGIAVIRISGSRAIEVADRIWKGRSLLQAESHTAHLGHIVDPDEAGRIVDQAVATVFRAPRSFTGEDVVELSVHGSSYIQAETMRILTEHGARVAEPGEFTQRAFKNGRLDLAEAEAVADIIASSSRAAHRLAVSQLSGKFSSHIDSLREQLINLASLLELELDFSEEDVDFADRTHLRSLAEKIISHLGSLAATFSAGQAIVNGVPVAIIGRPNAGKSSLLNALLGHDRAIVSDIPGTTRDTVEDSTEIDGHLIRFIDTAGIRSTDDPIENLGIERALKSVTSATIVLHVIDPAEFPYETLNDTLSQIPNTQATIIPLLNKTDRLTSDQIPGHLGAIKERFSATPYTVADALAISATQGRGISALKETISAVITADLPDDESMIITNARHHQAITRALGHLSDLITAIDINLTPDLQAHHLREAITALATITGSITTPDLLQTIFTRFCIGK
ncbi:MAG: tRNA uridine-5-carboxymethylaminomethyl(34) synthesis GTPase MnmE [Muribaculaceae bacterium]|nr:tRNA uridine-5-carboxymethylaminomethyl(34) synthesis GTPase MnmE [Muribaculaceae bacterium]